MKRLIFLDTNWVMGIDYVIESDFPCQEFKLLLSERNDIDEIIITPTVFDELVNKVGWERILKFKIEYPNVVKEKIIKFPYEVFTRIRNRHPSVFKELLPQQPNAASYMLSNDFLILHEIIAIALDRSGDYGKTQNILLTHDNVFEKMIDKWGLIVTAQKSLPERLEKKWVKIKYEKNNNDLLYIRSDLLSSLSGNRLASNVKQDMEQIHINSIWKNDLYKESANYKEYKIESHFATLKKPRKEIINFLITIDKGNRGINVIDLINKDPFYQFQSERLIVALIMKNLEFILENEKDWWLTTYFE